MTDWERKAAKRDWAKSNPDKVYLANKSWRQAFKTRSNKAAAERMKRYRRRLNVTGLPDFQVRPGLSENKSK